MHGLLEIVFLNRNNREVAAQANARDPGHNQQRRAEADLSEALDALHDYPTTLGEEPSDFSVIRHADEAWVLPLTSQGQTIAAKVIPAGTRRYGLHYILTGEEGLAIADSIKSAN